MNEFIVPSLFPDNIDAFFTTRSLGVQLDTISYRKNNIEPSRIYLPLQRHTSHIIILDGDMSPRVADGVITQRKNIMIGVQVADCVPVLISDPAKEVIGAVHAGWRGTAEGILRKALRMMKDVFSSDPRDILIAIGPSIKGCCYEVDEDVAESVLRARGINKIFVSGKYYIDLQEENLEQALMEEVRRENIWLSSECTKCNPMRFYSHRNRQDEGRQAGFIMQIDKT